MEILLAQEGEMGKGAERAIPYEHVPRAPPRMERRHLGHVVGVPGGHEHLQQESGAGMKQGEQMGHGEPTPRTLPTGLAKRLLEFRCIGHRETRPVDQERAVAPPPPLVVGRLLTDCGRPPQQLLPDDERQPGAGLTKCGGGEVLRDQMGQMGTRGVPMQDLQEEEMDGGDRIEQARTPVVADLSTEGENHGGVKQDSDLCFDMSECVRHCANHREPPVCKMS